MKALCGITRLLVTLVAVLPLVAHAQGQGGHKFSRTDKYVPGQLIVRYKDSTTAPRIGAAASAAAPASTLSGAKVARTFRKIRNLRVVALPDGVSVQQALEQFRADPNVLYAEPDYIVHSTEVVPNDPLFTSLWGLKNTGQSGGTVDADIDATDAWTHSTGSNSVIVGVIDSGVDTTHPDLAGNVFTSPSDCNNNHIDDDGDGKVDNCHGWNAASNNGFMYDDVGHGTHVSGTIGASGNNALGVVGVNWNVTILPCKFLGPNGSGGGSGATSDAIECLDYFATMKDLGYNIVATNNSWGGGGYSQALYDAIKENMDRGILFVAAAGNGGSDGVGDNNDQVFNFPSNYDLENIIAVEATTRTDARAGFSNFGRRSVDIGAPGAEILSTLPGVDQSGNPNYGVYSGTSMATPHVTGAVALLKAWNPALTAFQIRNLLFATGDTKTATSQTLTGKRLNVNNAMNCVNSTITQRTIPVASAVVGGTETGILLQALNINCGSGAGNVTVAVSPGNTSITLLDDGTNGDRVAGDGIYAARWITNVPGNYTLTFPGSDVVTATVVQPYAYVSEPYQYVNFTGTNLNLGDDTSATITSPFPIDFGGKQFSQLKVGSNGVLSFLSGYNSSGNESIPTHSTGDLIAPFWMDLMPQGSGNAKNVFWTTVGSAPNRELVVEWRNVPFWWPNVDLTATVKFQVVFFENSSDIVFNYADVLFYDGSYDGDYGGYATVGVQVGADGRQFSFAQKALQNGMSLRWKAGQPDYVLEIEDSPQHTAPGSPVTLHGKVKAAPGYTGAITLSCTSRITDPPPICTPSPATVAAGDEFTVEASSAAYGLLRFNVTGDDGMFERNAWAELQVGDFIFEPLAQTEFTMPRRSFASSGLVVSATRVSSSENYILVTCDSGLPAGMSCYTAFIGPIQGQSSTGYLYFNAGPDVVPGTYPVVLKAFMQGSPEVQKQTVMLTVTLNPSIHLSGLGSIGLLRGTSATFPFVTQALDGYNGTTTLSCEPLNMTVLPVTCSFDPPVVHGDANVVLTVSAPANAVSQTFNMWIKAYDNGILLDNLTPTTSVFEYNVQVNPTSPNLLVGGDTNLAVTIGGATNEPVTLACNGLPPGVSCRPTPSSIWPGTAAGLNLTSNPLLTVPGTKTFTVTGSAMGGIRSSNLTLTISDFSLSSSTVGDLSLNVGASATRSIQAKALGGVGGPLTLSCAVSGAPVGVSCSVPASVTPTATGANVSVIVTAALGSSAGAYTVVVTGSDAVLSHTYSFLAQARGYHLVATPSSRAVGTVPSGQTDHTTYALSAFGDNGFSSSVTLSCVTPLPTGVTCAFSPSSLIPNGSGATSTLTLTVSSTTPPGNYSLNVKGVSGTITRQLPLTLITGGPNFTQVVTPATVSAVRGTGGSYTVTYTLLGGMSDPIAVGCSAAAAGITCAANPDTVIPGVTPSNQSTVTFNTTGGTPTANTMVAITGSALGIVRSNSVTLSVKDFSLTSTTAGDLSITAGATAMRSVQAKSLNGLTGAVALSCAIDGAPAGVTCAVPATITPSSTGASFNATIATTSAAPAGGYLVTVSGTTGGQTRQYQFTAQIRDYSVFADNVVSIGNIPAGQTDVVLNPFFLSALNGFNSTVSLSCAAPLPTGVTCSFSPVSLVPGPGFPTPPTHSSLTLKVSPTTPNGAYPITVHLTTGTLVKSKTFTLNVGGPNFIPTIAPASAGSLLGTPAMYTVTFLTAGGMNTPIDVTCEAAVAVACNANPAQVTPGVTPGNQSIITVTGTPGVTPLANTLVLVSGYSSDLNRHRGILATYAPRDFALSTTTPARVVNAASSVATTVTTKALNGFSGLVALACSIDNAPAGMTCTLPASVSPSSTGSSLSVTVATTAATPAGTYTVHVNGSNSGQTRSMTFTVDVRDFSLQASPSTQTIPGTATGSTTFSLTLTALNGFASTVSLSCATPLPTGLTCAFSPASMVPSGAGSTSTLTVNVTASNTQGDHPLTIRTASGGLVRQQAVTVTHGP